jgi:hypothetical protein
MQERRKAKKEQSLAPVHGVFLSVFGNLRIFGITLLNLFPVPQIELRSSTERTMIPDFPKLPNTLWVMYCLFTVQTPKQTFSHNLFPLRKDSPYGTSPE